MLGDGADVVDIVASSRQESFPSVAVLGGGEDDDVAKCLITLAARHEALRVAVDDGSRGHADVFGEFLGKQLGLTVSGAPFARFADGTCFTSDEVFDIVEALHHASFQRKNKRTILMSRKSLVHILSGNLVSALDSLKSFSREDVLL
jgi:hypothetical protein